MRDPQSGAVGITSGVRESLIWRGLLQICYQERDAVVMRLWGKAVTLGYTTDFATAAYGEQVELTLSANSSRWQTFPKADFRPARARMLELLYGPARDRFLAVQWIRRA